MAATATENNASEWTVVEESYDMVLDKDTIIKLSKTILRRNRDGLEVTRSSVGHPEDMSDIFLFKGGFGEIEIRARRMGPDLYQISNKYVVQLNTTYLKEPELILAKSMAKDIVSALLNYPPGRLYDYIPVKQVVFSVNSGFQPRKILTLEELNG